MIKPKVVRHYWDSCTFLNVIQGVEPSGDNSLRTLTQWAAEGKILIITSTLTLAEVVRPHKRSKSQDSLSRESEQRVVEAFESEAVVLVELDQIIAERAREIQWGISGIKPVDAIHLATAERAKVDKFDTFDMNSIVAKVKQASGFVWNHPFEIGQPSVPQAELPL